MARHMTRVYVSKKTLTLTKIILKILLNDINEKQIQKPNDQECRGTG